MFAKVCRCVLNSSYQKGGSVYQEWQLVTQCQWINILAVYLDLLHLKHL